MALEGFRPARFNTEDVAMASEHQRIPILASDLLADLGMEFASKIAQRVAVADWLTYNEPSPILLSDLEDEDLLGGESNVDSPTIIAGDRFIGKPGTHGVSVRNV